MIFQPLPIAGAWRIVPEPRADDRGLFARVWCREAAARHGVDVEFVQSNVSWNRRRGTLRGLHHQAPPHAEAKLVRCTSGAVWDVILDLRPDSESFGRWTACELTAENRHALFVPEGCAHGFQTLLDGSELTYQMSAAYAAEASRGVRWNDPAFRIAWPDAPERILAPRDAAWPDFEFPVAAVGAVAAAEV